MPRPQPCLRRLGLATLLLVAASGAAMAQNVCTARATPDGFVALRDSPSAKGKLVVKMVPDDMVVIDRDPRFPSGYVPVQRGQWLKASHFRGEEFPEPGDPGYEKVRRGWVHEKLITDCG